MAKELKPEELSLKVTAKLLDVLQEQFSDEADMFQTIAPIIPALVNLGVSEGTYAAEQVMIGLTSEDPYPHWQRIIDHATPEERIKLMEKTCQAAIRDKLDQIQRNELRWETLRVVLKVGVSVLGLLLL